MYEFDSIFCYFQLQLGVDESYTLFVAKNDGQSIIEEATIEVNLRVRDCGYSFFGGLKLIE